MFLKILLPSAVALAITVVAVSPVRAAPITFDYSGGIVQYTVTQSGLYEIGALGANGGKSGNWNLLNHGGQGIGLWGELDLLAGDVLSILVGGGGGYDINRFPDSAPIYYGASGGGGGGGSFVVSASGRALVVAGGGGGGGEDPGGNGRAPEAGGSHGGTSGEGHRGISQGGGGGGGFSQSGIDASGASAGRGRAFTQGGAGGNGTYLRDVSLNPVSCINMPGCYNTSGYGGDGGFGGGGGGGGIGGGGYGGAGGGGGYSGGNGSEGFFTSDPAGGGTSYLGQGVIASSRPYIFNMGGDGANGLVSMNLLRALEPPPAPGAVPEPGSIPLVASALAVLALVRKRGRFSGALSGSGHGRPKP